MGELQIVLRFPAYPHCKLIQFNINPYVVQSLSYSFFCLLTLSSSNKTLPPNNSYVNHATTLRAVVRGRGVAVWRRHGFGTERARLVVQVKELRYVASRLIGVLRFARCFKKGVCTPL